MLKTPIFFPFPLDKILNPASTRPSTMSELYDKADGLPNFDLLQPYREDDKINKTFYSNPNYFLELWKKQFEEAALAERQKRKEQRKARKEAKTKKNPKRYVHVYTKIETRNDRIRAQALAEGKLHQQQLAKTLSMDFENLPLPGKGEYFTEMIVTAKG